MMLMLILRILSQWPQSLIVSFFSGDQPLLAMNPQATEAVPPAAEVNDASFKIADIGKGKDKMYDGYVFFANGALSKRAIWKSLTRVLCYTILMSLVN